MSRAFCSLVLIFKSQVMKSSSNCIAASFTYIFFFLLLLPLCPVSHRPQVISCQPSYLLLSHSRSFHVFPMLLKLCIKLLSLCLDFISSNFQRNVFWTFTYVFLSFLIQHQYYVITFWYLQEWWWVDDPHSFLLSPHYLILV